MTREDAVQRFLEGSPRASRTVGLLMRWNPAKTVTQNALALKLNQGQAWHTAKKYGLTYQKGLADLDRDLAKRLRSRGLTYKNIGQVLGVSGSRIHQVCQ